MMLTASVRMRVAFVASVIGVVLAVPAYAQDGAAMADDPGDIVVTARRVEERLQDVPISITVFNQQQLDNRNIVTASDLATYTPSLTSNSRFGPDKASFTIRGFSQESNTSPTVGVYFADVVAPRSAAGTTSGNGAGPGSLFDLQNVQVLKGPQGTLFGRNTTGGAILLVPQKPTDSLEGYVEGTIGNYDQRRLQAVVNIPLAETFKVRFGVDRNVRDGYLKNRSGVGPGDYGDVDYSAYRASIVAELTPDLENYIVASYSKSDTHGILGRLVACTTTPNATQRQTALSACQQIDRQNARGDGFYDVEGSVPGPYNKSTQWQIINTTTWKASDNLTIKNVASYGEYKDQLAFNISGDNFFVADPTSRFLGRPYATTTLNRIPGRDSAAQSTFSEELQFQGQTTDGSLNWQAGGYLEISKPLGGNTSYSQSTLYCEDVTSLQCQGYFPSSSLSIVDNEVSYRNIGLYSQATYKITEKLAATGGIRYTWDRTAGSGDRLTVSFPTANVPVGRCANPLLRPGLVTLNLNDCSSPVFVEKSQRPTWTIDLEYKPSIDVLLFAKYSRGYRQGGVNPSIIGLETWNPEKVDTYEVGAKGSFSGAVNGFINVTGFYNDFTDQQLSATTFGCTVSTCGFNSGLPGARIVVNAGRSRIWGIEVDSSITPFRGFKLDAAYAYLNTKLLDFVVPELPAGTPYVPPTADAGTEGGVLPLSPKHRVTLTAAYTLPLDESIGRVSFAATYTYTTKQLSSTSSIVSFLPSNELLNLNLNWANIAGLPVDLAAFATNVTKEEFPVSVTNNWQSRGFETVITNQPRTYGLRLKYRFGS
jgi:iron complex outermembrane receptor protein